MLTLLSIILFFSVATSIVLYSYITSLRSEYDVLMINYSSTLADNYALKRELSNINVASDDLSSYTEDLESIVGLVWEIYY